MPVISYSYNTQLQPPAPFVLIVVRNPITGAERTNVPAQIDTAADRSLLPGTLANDLLLPAIGELLIGGVAGTATTMKLHAAAIGIHDLPARPVEVVAHLGEAWALIGRDVLNGLKLTLDGPQLTLSLG